MILLFRFFLLVIPLFCLKMHGQQTPRDRRIEVERLIRDMQDNIYNVPVALQLAEKVQKLDPSNVQVIALKGLVFAQNKEYAKALKEFNTYLIIRPQSNLYANRGLVKAEMGDTSGALSDAEKAFKNAGGEFIVIRDVAQIYERLGNTKKAATLYLQSIKVSPRSPSGYSSFA